MVAYCGKRGAWSTYSLRSAAKWERSNYVVFGCHNSLAHSALDSVRRDVYAEVVKLKETLKKVTKLKSI